ncbi:MAG TPA: hypothetical protein VF556_07310 [Pyrinomonadaceae bacterium]
MKKAWFLRFAFFVCLSFSLAFGIQAQAQNAPAIKSQEVSDADGIPVLVKHLPEWKNVRNSVTFTNNVDDLRKALGERPVYDLIDFSGGTEAVMATYPQGKLLIVEYATPQGSSLMDGKTVQRLSEIGQTQNIFYRRIGNYNTFVFDAPDEARANALLEQVKYEKEVQWLGENPFLQSRAEYAFIQTTSDIFVSTVLAIILGLGISVLLGILVGIVFFYIRDQKRATTEAFSDAGGMTRLNLDELSAQIIPKNLLKD